VMGMLSLLQTTALTEEQQKMADTITKSGESLLTVINDVLDFSKIEAGKLELHSGPFNLLHVIEETVEIFAYKTFERKINLYTDIDLGLPETCIGDKQRIRQILINLIGNALKFIEKGYVKISARKVKINGSSKLSISVKDTGPGIPEDQLQTIFNPFEQTHHGKTSAFGGTGLGLPIIAKLIRMMNGSIRVESKVNRGSTFEITLPLKYQGKSLANGIRLKYSGLKHMTVLMVGRDSKLRRILGKAIRKTGARVVALHPDKLIMKMLERNPIDLVLVDEPELKWRAGNSFMRYFQKKNIPVVALTSMSERYDGQIHIRIKKYLDKPVKIEEACKIFQELVLDISAVSTGISVKKEWKHFAKEHPLQILLVEDHPINQKMAVKMLQKLGYHPYVADNGKQAVLKCKQAAYDLIFMDIQMPEMDGYAATREIRILQSVENPPVIIALTANATVNSRQESKLAGMHDFMAKPFSLQDLAGMIEKWG
jgi:CheY-like chemotaxis protein